MNIAFLGLGRMGRILATHLIGAGHDVAVWNRSTGPAEPFADLGARVATSATDAVHGAEMTLTCLFGPDSVRDVVLEPGLSIPVGSIWVDISTVGPIFADESDAWADDHGVRYVHSPVLGSLGPARAHDLGVLIGGTNAATRTSTREVVSVWADPARVVEYDTPAKAAVGKLVVNLSLAVGYQGLIEAARVGEAGGLRLDESLALAGLPKTPFSVIAGMKGAQLASGDYADTQFSTDLLAKDADLMLRLAAGRQLPALTAAFAALEHARRAGLGDADFSAMAFDAGL
jgi:3-hydroxyisobutyrate dehydrogenase